MKLLVLEDPGGPYFVGTIYSSIGSTPLTLLPKGGTRACGNRLRRPGRDWSKKNRSTESIPGSESFSNSSLSVFWEILQSSSSNFPVWNYILAFFLFATFCNVDLQNPKTIRNRETQKGILLPGVLISTWTFAASEGCT